VENISTNEVFSTKCFPSQQSIFYRVNSQEHPMALAEGGEGDAWGFRLRIFHKEASLL